MHGSGQGTSERKIAAAPVEEPEELNGEEVLKRLEEILDYGWGRVEVTVQDHDISTLQWQKVQVRKKRKKE